MHAHQTRLVAIAMLAACLGSPVAASDDDAKVFERAMQAYAHDRYAQAFADLGPLADGGHTEAARIAWLMQRHGPRLYGTRFTVEPGRAGHWLAVAAAAHDAVRSARR